MQTQVFLNSGFVGLPATKTRVPWYPGLIMSVRRPDRVDGKPTVSGHLSETDLIAIRRLLYATRRPAVDGSKLKQYELYEYQGC